MSQSNPNPGSPPPDEGAMSHAQCDAGRGEDFEDLDPDTRAAIDEAEAEYARGEGIPVEEAAARLRRKLFGG